jgi:hypothetical protein
MIYVCVLIFSTPFAWNLSHYERSSARYCHKFLHVKYLLFMSEYTSNQNWIFSTEWRKSSNIKFIESPSSGCWVVSCGQKDTQTDRNDEASNCFSQFFESASKLAEFPLPHMSSFHADGQVYILYLYELCHEPLFSSPRRKFELDNMYYDPV